MKFDKNTLIIFDCSSQLHIGFNQPPYCHYKTSNTHYPTGAIYGLLSTVFAKYMFDYKSPNCPTLAFVFDRKSDRKSADSTYKSSRQALKLKFLSQSRNVEKGLEKAGFNVFSAKDTEADDIILQIAINHSIYNTTNNLPKFTQIVIYGRDRDLFTAINDTTVVMQNKTTIFNKESFQYLDFDKCYVPYNMISLYKTLRMDKSDEIKPLIPPKLYHRVIDSIQTVIDPSILNIPYEFKGHPNYPKQFYDRNPNIDLNLLVLQGLTSTLPFKEEAINRYLKYFKRKQMSIEEVPSVVPQVDLNINEDFLAMWLSSLQMKSILKRFNLSQVDAPKGYLDWYRNQVALMAEEDAYVAVPSQTELEPLSNQNRTNQVNLDELINTVNLFD